jgi:hypothetical protein
MLMFFVGNFFIWSFFIQVIFICFFFKMFLCLDKNFLCTGRSFFFDNYYGNGNRARGI